MPKSVHIIWDRFSCRHEKLSDIMWTWSKFHVCYHFLDTYENPGRRTFINLSCSKHPKIINWNKKWHRFLFSYFFVVLQKGFIFLRHQKEVWNFRGNCTRLYFFLTQMWTYFKSLLTRVSAVWFQKVKK